MHDYLAKCCLLVYNLLVDSCVARLKEANISKTSSLFLNCKQLQIRLTTVTFRDFCVTTDTERHIEKDVSTNQFLIIFEKLLAETDTNQRLLRHKEG